MIVKISFLFWWFTTGYAVTGYVLIVFPGDKISLKFKQAKATSILLNLFPTLKILFQRCKPSQVLRGEPTITWIKGPRASRPFCWRKVPHRHLLAQLSGHRWTRTWYSPSDESDRVSINRVATGLLRLLFRQSSNQRNDDLITYESGCSTMKTVEICFSFLQAATTNSEHLELNIQFCSGYDESLTTSTKFWELTWLGLGCLELSELHYHSSDQFTATTLA